MILGTEGTIQGQKYTETLKALDESVETYGLACPLFVPVIEEGWHKHPVAETIALEYFQSVSNLTSFDTAVLGCTHYPLLKPVLSKLFPHMHFIDSAETTAGMVKESLMAKGLLHQNENLNHKGQTLFLVTDNLQRFRKVGYYFIGETPTPLQMVDLTDSDEQIVANLL